MPKDRRGKHRRHQSRSSLPYSVGQVNMIIDDIFEPLKESHWIWILVVETFHMIIEGNFEQSLQKFARFSLPELLKKLFEKKG